MWPNRQLIELLNIEHPFVLSPMAGFTTLELAASVCAAGGLGSVGCATMQPEVAAKTIRELRALTNKPFSVNFFCHVQAPPDPAREQAWRDRLAPYFEEFGIDHGVQAPRMELPPFGDAMCRVVEDARPAVVSFHFGLPGPALLGRVKAAGCRVISSATTVEEALWLEAQGADAVIAQGYDGGGHRATFLAADIDGTVASQLGTMTLLPQIVDAVRIPVIAAGGITDGRGIAAAFALGAAGTQMGTAYLLCPEAGTSPLQREAFRSASADATVLTNVFTGRPARALTNRLTREVGPISDAVSAFPTAMADTGLLRAAAERQGSTDFTPFWAGQAFSRSREMPASALTAELAKEAFECFKRLDSR